MRSDHVVPLLLLAALGGCAASTAGETREARPQVEAMSLATRGEPRRCLPLRDANGFRPVNENVLMVRVGASRWYRNELRARCPNMRPQNTIVVRASGGTVCEGDVFEVVDPVSRINFGVCGFGTFVPVDVPRGVDLK